MLTTRWAAAPLVVATALLAGCTPGRAGGAPLPPSPARIDVTMVEYEFRLPATVPSGRQVFRVTNAGALEHSLVLVSLAEDVPPILDQLRSQDRRGAPTFAKFAARPPGSQDTFAVELPPGRYALICFVTDADGNSHAAKGMASEFRVE
jgi:hypothetical protein